MLVGDIPQVVAIDRLSFPLPWSESTYRREISDNANSHFLVAWRPGRAGPPARGLKALLRRDPPRQVLGYIGFWHVVDEAHISTLAVRPDVRRQGVGDCLLRGMLDKARALGARMATLEVRVSNLDAQRLYARHGFIEVGRRKAYYRDNQEDALLLTLMPLAFAAQPHRPHSEKLTPR
jgi:ribosomal-protein-alanine N-acetyltransferase